MENVLKMDFMVKRSQMKGRLLVHENYKSRWFKLTTECMYYCDGKLEVGNLALQPLITYCHYGTVGAPQNFQGHGVPQIKFRSYGT